MNNLSNIVETYLEGDSSVFSGSTVLTTSMFYKEMKVNKF